MEISKVVADGKFWIVNDKYRVSVDYAEFVIKEGSVEFFLDKWFKAGNIAISKTLSADEQISIYTDKLTKLHEDIVKKVQDRIAGKPYTRALEKEYENKEKEALEALKNNDFAIFELSAQMKKITAKQYALLVVDKAKKMRAAENNALIKIGDIRIFINDLIKAQEFFKAKKIIEYLSELEADDIIKATNKHLIELIQTYEN